jgi:hypothetical protein
VRRPKAKGERQKEQKGLPLHPFVFRPLPFAFRRAGRLHWATLAFLLGFTALLIVLGYFYLAPGAEALADTGADAEKRQRLKAFSSLLLAVMLVLLFVLMLIVFRVRRFFFDDQPRTKTEYPDAWSESARRLRLDDESETR